MTITPGPSNTPLILPIIHLDGQHHRIVITPSTSNLPGRTIAYMKGSDTQLYSSAEKAQDKQTVIEKGLIYKIFTKWFWKPVVFKTGNDEYKVLLVNKHSASKALKNPGNISTYFQNLLNLGVKVSPLSLPESPFKESNFRNGKVQIPGTSSDLAIGYKELPSHLKGKFAHELANDSLFQETYGNEWIPVDRILGNKRESILLNKKNIDEKLVKPNFISKDFVAKVLIGTLSLDSLRNGLLGLIDFKMKYPPDSLGIKNQEKVLEEIYSYCHTSQLMTKPVSGSIKRGPTFELPLITTIDAKGHITVEKKETPNFILSRLPASDATDPQLIFGSQATIRNQVHYRELPANLSSLTLKQIIQSHSYGANWIPIECWIKGKAEILLVNKNDAERALLKAGVLKDTIHNAFSVEHSMTPVLIELSRIEEFKNTNLLFFQQEGYLLGRNGTPSEQIAPFYTLTKEKEIILAEAKGNSKFPTEQLFLMGETRNGVILEANLNRNRPFPLFVSDSGKITILKETPSQESASSNSTISIGDGLEICSEELPKFLKDFSSSRVRLQAEKFIKEYGEEKLEEARSRNFIIFETISAKSDKTQKNEDLEICFTPEGDIFILLKFDELTKEYTAYNYTTGSLENVLLDPASNSETPHPLSIEATTPRILPGEENPRRRVATDPQTPSPSVHPRNVSNSFSDRTSPLSFLEIPAFSLPDEVQINRDRDFSIQLQNLVDLISKNLSNPKRSEFQDNAKPFLESGDIIGLEKLYRNNYAKYTKSERSFISSQFSNLNKAL